MLLKKAGKFVFQKRKEKDFCAKFFKSSNLILKRGRFEFWGCELAPGFNTREKTLGQFTEKPVLGAQDLVIQVNSEECKVTAAKNAVKCFKYQVKNPKKPAEASPVLDKNNDQVPAEVPSAVANLFNKDQTVFSMKDQGIKFKNFKEEARQERNYLNVMNGKGFPVDPFKPSYFDGKKEKQVFTKPKDIKLSLVRGISFFLKKHGLHFLCWDFFCKT